jgi:hypothetical protein
MARGRESADVTSLRDEHMPRAVREAAVGQAVAELPEVPQLARRAQQRERVRR